MTERRLLGDDGRPNFPAQITRLIPPASFLLLALSLAYLATKSVFSSDEPSDFQFIWLAGDMWRDGLNPYSETYTELGREMFVGMHPPEVWFYPPNWWAVARIFAVPDFAPSLVLWRGFGALCLIAGTLWVALACHRQGVHQSVLRVNGTLIYLCLMSATPIALALGQTTFLSFLGLSLFAAAYLSGNRAAMVVAIVLLVLKPQIGLPFCFFLLAERRWWVSLGAAACVTILAAVPAFFYVDPLTFLEQYVAQFSFHNEMLPNHPRAMVGLRNIGYDLFDIRLSTLPLTLVAAAIAFASGLLPATDGSHRAAKVSLAIIVTCVVVPLHTYDMMLLAPLVLLMAPMTRLSQGLVLAGLLIIFRANNIAEVTGFFDQTTTHFVGSRITSIGLIVVLAGVLLGAFALFNRRRFAETDVSQQVRGS